MEEYLSTTNCQTDIRGEILPPGDSLMENGVKWEIWWREKNICPGIKTGWLRKALLSLVKHIIRIKI
jgi:hypothetical protein